MKLEFSRQILEKNSQISNFMKIIRPRGAELFREDGRTEAQKNNEANSRVSQLREYS